MRECGCRWRLREKKTKEKERHDDKRNHNDGRRVQGEVGSDSESDHADCSRALLGQYGRHKRLNNAERDCLRDVRTLEQSVVRLQFGITECIEVNWGADTGSGTFYHDIKTAVKNYITIKG